MAASSGRFAARWTSTSSASSGAAALLSGIDLVEGALEDVDGERRLALDQMDRGDGAGRRGVGRDVDVGEQLLGFLESSLHDAEIGEADEGAVAQQRALTEAPEPHRFGQRGVGLGPASGGGQHAAVVRAAERGDCRKPSAVGDRLADADPLIGTRDVVRVLACREELAKDLLEHHEVVDLAARHRGECLVEQQHALLGAVGVDEACSEVGERHELQVGVAEAAGQHECLPEERLLAGPVALEHRDVERHPPAFR